MNKTLAFGEWAPDLADIQTPTTDAKNVIPHQGSYLPFPSLVTTSNALTDYVRAAEAMEDKDGNVEVYAGDETNLYRLGTSETWADLSGATYTTAVRGFWRFVRYGEAVIATNLADPVQTKIFGAGTNFAALAGSPPKSKCLAVVKSFVVLGDIDDGTHCPNKLQWSGQNLETAWGSNASTQADSQLLAGDGGAIQAIMSGDVGVIFQERSIWELVYQGPPVIFSLHETAFGLGTPAPRSVVQYGNVSYFLGQDGFYQYVIGKGPTPIGDKKVDLWFLDRVEKTNIHRMVAAIDIPNGKVMWAYPTGSGDCDEILIFDYKTGQWSYAAVDTQTIFSGRSVGYTLEGLDAISTDIDALPASLDADIWKGGVLSLYGADTAKKIGSFSGPALMSRLETVEITRDDAMLTYVDSIRPLVQGAGANTVFVGTRANLGDTVVYGSGITANTIGEHNTRTAARYMRFRVETSGGFERAIGTRVNAQAQGIR